MSSQNALTMLVAMVVLSAAESTPISNNELLGLGRLFDFGSRGAVPAADETKAKRSALDVLNGDATFELKQHVSLQSLIESVESNLWQAASGANGVAHSKTPLAEVRPAQQQHQLDDSSDATSHVIVREVATGTAQSTSTSTPTTTPTTSVHAAADATVLLQTSHRAPTSVEVSGGTNGGSVLHIDRITVQPFSGGLPPPLPAFQLVITRSHSNEDDNGASKAAATTTTSATSESASATTTKTTTTTTTATSSSVSSEATTPKAAATSTKVPAHEELKKAEEELKEKVAEIEAEPVILSARV